VTRSSTIPRPHHSSFARALQIAAAILTITSLTRGVLDYLAEPEHAIVLVVRGIQVAAMFALTVVISPRLEVPTLHRLAFLVALIVPLSSVVVAPFDLDETWPAITICAAVMMGAALFVGWSWRWQAAVACTVTIAAAVVILVWVPRSAFPWRDVALALFLLTAAAIGSVWGAHLSTLERQRMLDSEAGYRSLFESAADAIALLDHHGVIRRANARLADLVGRPLAELVGRPFTDLYAAQHRDSAPSPGHEAARTGALQRGTHTFVHANGRAIDVEVSYAPIDGGPEPVVQAIVHDLTEQRTLERREIKDQRADALEGLAGGMAHQFNNILGGILTHAAVLRADAAPPAAAELDEILDAARRGRDLTKELLRFTRSEPLSLRPTAPRAVLDSVAALARTSLPETVQIDLRVPEQLPALLGDADHLAHACLELVFNARDAMRGMPSGRLTLEAAAQDVPPGDTQWPNAAPGSYVRLSVIDTGRGMDTTTRERVFEPFFTTKPMHRASGMGLATVYGIVRDHKGSIRLDTAPGRGTAVHLLLPISTEPAAAAVAAPTPAATAAPAGPDTILVVDDEAIVRHSLRRALTRFGYRVLEAIDGPSALAELEKANPPVRLVILDLVLPGGGAGILELLRALQPDLKVLVSSGYSPDADIVKDMVRRVEGFLPKPYEMSELRSAVAKALAG
jgi:PAS domain S-box-containing protein